MPVRVILGKKNGENGLWVSVPGKDALSSTSPEDFLIDTTRLNMIPIMAGVISNPTLSYNSGLSQGISAGDHVNSAATPSSDGYSTYIKDYNHNLGYIPICFFSISVSTVGLVYPTIKVDATKVRLYHRIYADVSSNTAQDWGKDGKLVWWQTTAGSDYVGIGLADGVADTVSFPCDIHYTIYRQSTGAT